MTIVLKLVNVNIFSEMFLYVDFDKLSYGHIESVPLKSRIFIILMRIVASKRHKTGLSNILKRKWRIGEDLVLHVLRYHLCFYSPKRCLSLILLDAPPLQSGMIRGGVGQTIQFLKFIEHIEKHIRPSVASPVLLLLLDNYVSHVDHRVIYYCFAIDG